MGISVQPGNTAVWHYAGRIVNNVSGWQYCTVMVRIEIMENDNEPGTTR